MRVRAQDQNGDYTFGRGAGNFLVDNNAAVAQLIQTALLLQQGEWFLDSTVGTPWSTDILGYDTAPLYDIAIQQVILGVPGVASIQSYSSNLNTKTRALSVSVTVTTIYDTTASVNVTL
jgi:hypothetical protein